MLNRFFGINTHRNLHLFGLCTLAIGVPLNKVVMSLSMMFIVLNLLLEGDFKTYFERLKKNKLYLLILGFYLLHVVSVIWSENMDYILYDLRVKLPLLVIPTILAAKPIENRLHLHLILVSISLSTFLITILNFAFYNQWFGHREYEDIRAMSIFTSHIRFAIIVAFVIGIIFYFIQKHKQYRIPLIMMATWLLYYTLYSQVLSGVISVIVVFCTFSVYLFWKKNKVIVLSIFSILTLSTILGLVWLFSPITIDLEKYSNLEKTTIEGHDYSHSLDVVSPLTEEPILIYICKREIDRDWDLYSTFDINGMDKKGQPLRETIIRFLSSKKMRKDALALSKLSKNEIQSIENGVTSILNEGILTRFFGLKYQLLNKGNPNGHSLLQRLEYWKTGAQLIRQQPFLGVGAGDIQDAFNQQYLENNSTLIENNRRRTHSYYLTMWITFGIVGLAYFLWIHFLFIKQNITRKEILGILFIFIILASFLIEDTIESQTGVTFYALFYGLFSFSISEEGT